MITDEKLNKLAKLARIEIKDNEREKIKSLYKTNTISKEEKEDLKRMKVKRIR